jgi:hypothetical protein
MTRPVHVINDVKSQLVNIVPDETWVYPSRGDGSTLGKQTAHRRMTRTRLVAAVL